MLEHLPRKGNRWGVPLLPSALGWAGQGRQEIKKEKTIKYSAFRRSEFSELQNKKFSFPF
jgi:hypothetical protein